MKNKYLLLFLFLGMLILPSNLIGQMSSPEVDFTEETLELFVLALLDVQEIQLEMNNQVETIMQSADIQPERLIEIHQTLSQGIGADSFNQSEIAVYELTMEEIAVVEQEAQQVMTQVVEANGITVEQYNQIIALAQQDQDFMEKIQQLISSMSS
jgi:hypothetical protein